jgi:hypothetical protein
MSVYLGPSSASRWLKCTASPGFLDRNADRLPKQSSWYADEGTEAHDYAGQALALAGLYDYDVIPNKDMRIHVQSYVEFVSAKQRPGDQLIVETRIPLFYMQGRNGIVDAAIVGETIEIWDLKYGAGIMVDAVDNVQLAIYGKSLLDDLRRKGRTFDPKMKMKIGIYQPRTRQGDPIREWSLTVGELELFCEPIASTAAGILLNPEGGEFYPEPEKVCRFCDAQSICGAYAARMLGELPADTPVAAIVPAAKPSEAGFPSPQSLTPEQLKKVITISGDFEKWLEACRKYGRSLLDEGKEFPGFKLVAGKGAHRKWTDEDEAGRLLRQRLDKEQVYEKKIISPAQAETLLKGIDLSTRFENKLQSLIIKPEGGPTMVPEDDPRPALNAASVFTDITENIDTSDLI